MDSAQTHTFVACHDNKITPNLTVGLSLIVLCGFTLFVYRETVAYLLNDWMQWQHGEYAHGLLVLALAIFMVWDQRETLQQYTHRPVRLAVLLVIFFSLTWMTGKLLGIRIVESLSFYMLIPASILFLAGWNLLVKLRCPLLFVLVAFPVWEPLLPILQSTASSLSYFFLKLTGTTASREGAYILVPAGKFLVAEGCSGLRYLLAAITFGGFYIYLERLTYWRAVLFLCCVTGAAIVANVLRITVVIIAGNLSDMQHPWVHDHLSLGWYIFAGMLIPVFWAGIRLSSLQQSIFDQIRPEKYASSNNNAPHYYVLLPILLIALITGPLLNQQFIDKASIDSEQVITLVAPSKLGQWNFHNNEINRSNQVLPLYKNADQVIDVAYVAGSDSVRLFIATYLNQTQDKELINVENYLYDETKWQPVTDDIVKVEETGLSVREIQLKNNLDENYLIWSWYRSAGNVTTKPVLAKLYDLYGIITGQTAASVIMIGTPIINDPDIERHRLNEFVLDMETEINRQLDQLNK